MGEENKHLNSILTIFYKCLIKYLELRQKKRNPHSVELAEKGGDTFSSFVLKESEFPLHVLQISQKQGPKLLPRVLHVLNEPTASPSGCRGALLIPSAMPGPREGAASTTGPSSQKLANQKGLWMD